MRPVATRLPFLAALLIAALSAGRPAAGEAGEMRLVMFETAGCEWCEVWNDEVGIVYDRTPEGRSAPLMRLDKRAELPVGLTIESPARYTPTFVLVVDGAEVGRIEGYPGEAFFWGLLGKMIETHGGAAAIEAQAGGS